MFTSAFHNIVKLRVSTGSAVSSSSRMKCYFHLCIRPRLPFCLYSELLVKPTSTLWKGHRSWISGPIEQTEANKQKRTLCDSSNKKASINYHELHGKHIEHCYLPPYSLRMSKRQFSPSLSNSYLALASCRFDDHQACSNSTKLHIFKKNHFHKSSVSSMINQNKPPSRSSRSSGSSQDGSDYDAAKTEKLQAQWKLDPRSVRRQSINTCRGLYVKLQQTKPKLYKYAPRNGIYFDVEYYDSRCSVDDQDFDDNQKVIVMLHGAPGTYKDFAAQITYFEQKGYRVIAPNLPDYNARVHKFRHSTQERYYYLEDFFRAINLTRIHMLIGHSAAVYVLMELLEKSQYLKINSIGLFNNPGHILPRQLQVTRVRMFFLEMYEHDFLRPILKLTVSLFLRVQGIVNRADKLDNLLLAASCVGYSEHWNLERQYEVIRSRNIPAFIVISDRDKLIPSEYYRMVLDGLKIASDQVNCYDDQGNLIKERSDKKSNSQVVELISGGHYSFQSHADIVNKEMEGFLKNFESQSNSDSQCFNSRPG